ncbi:DUF2958 domain-containing protein [Aliarcobacter cryaerophilus]|uniref:DUF2958 domain-containing protein n=1 Tax=Aliarcobacter cryaerophilus TaxID=28198 RepID=A0A2S9TKZ8_9BACT|nr:DUF2958 domain-containing protein [Aliarcobacter cryaerophilus]PRM99509.1 hypothetical protein CJ670_00295 [Arcobacter cryaerophilus gv. crypticus]
MKLLSDEQAEKLPPLYATENIATKDKIVKIKFFTPDSNWTWYAVEYDKNEKIFFGFVNGHYPEWGYFSLEELEQIKGPLGLHIERDIHFKEQPFGQIKELQ